MEKTLQLLQPRDPYTWDNFRDHRMPPIGPTKINPFKVGDKVESTKEHDRHFGSSTKGIIDNIDDNYINVYDKLKHITTLHSKWLKPYKDDLLFFYKGKLV